MIKKSMIQTELTGRQITSTLNIESFGHIGDEEDKLALVYRTHNGIVKGVYGDLIERLWLLSHEILSIDDWAAGEVNDNLCEIINDMECLYLAFGEDKEVF